MRFQRRLRCSNIPSPRTFWGRFGTMYKHATFESRCSLGTPESTAEAEAGRKLAKRFRRKLFRLVVQVSSCKAIYLVEAAGRFLDANGTAEPPSASGCSPDWVTRGRAILPWQ